MKVLPFLSAIGVGVVVIAGLASCTFSQDPGSVLRDWYSAVSSGDADRALAIIPPPPGTAGGSDPSSLLLSDAALEGASLPEGVTVEGREVGAGAWEYVVTFSIGNEPAFAEVRAVKSGDTWLYSGVYNMIAVPSVGDEMATILPWVAIGEVRVPLGNAYQEFHSFPASYPLSVPSDGIIELGDDVFVYQGEVDLSIGINIAEPVQAGFRSEVAGFLSECFEATIALDRNDGCPNFYKRPGSLSVSNAVWELNELPNMSLVLPARGSDAYARGSALAVEQDSPISARVSYVVSGLFGSRTPESRDFSWYVEIDSFEVSSDGDVAFDFYFRDEFGNRAGRT